MDLRPDAPLLVAPVDGAPRQTSERLSALTAASLRDIDIPATTEAGEAKLYVLEAKAEESSLSVSQTLLSLSWRLMDPSGGEAGAFEQVKQVSAKDWTQASPALLALLAEQAASRVKRLLRQIKLNRPLARPAPVFLPPVDGAPEDGRKALTSAMRQALGRNQIPLAGEIGDETYLLLGSVYVDEDLRGGRSIEVYWSLIEPSGREVGVVSQGDTVEQGSLEDAWDGIAEAVAEAAAEAILSLLRAAGPVPQGASGD